MPARHTQLEELTGIQDVPTLDSRTDYNGMFAAEKTALTESEPATTTTAKYVQITFAEHLWQLLYPSLLY